jgi:phosphatidylglycerophosphate synthase
MKILNKQNVIKYSDFISNYFYQQISFLITKNIYKTEITPNQITVLSLIFGLLSSFFIYYHYIVSGIIFLNISFILDCVDGQLARVKHMQSDFGMWLDNISDRVVENSVILAVIFANFNLIIIKGGLVLLFLNMLYAYMSDMVIYLNKQYRYLKLSEKIIFSPIYFISRSMIIPLLSLMIIYPTFIYGVDILYLYGIAFRLYREITGREDELNV